MSKGLFGSLVDLASDVVDIATAPVRIAVDVTRMGVKPIANAANEVVEEIREDVDSSEQGEGK